MLLLIIVIVAYQTQLFAQTSDLFVYDKVKLENELSLLTKVEQNLTNPGSFADPNFGGETGIMNSNMLHAVTQDSLNQKSYFLPALGISFVTSIIPGFLIGGLWGGLIGGAAGGLYILLINNKLTPQQRNQALKGCVVGGCTGAGIAFTVIFVLVLGASSY